MCFYFILFIYFFFHDIWFTHQLNLYVVYWIWLNIVQISQNAIWSNGTYAILAQIVWVVSPGVCVWGGRGRGGAEGVDIWQLF